MKTEELDRLAVLLAYQANKNCKDTEQAWFSTIHAAAPSLIALARWAEQVRPAIGVMHEQLYHKPPWDDAGWAHVWRLLDEAIAAYPKGDAGQGA